MNRHGLAVGAMLLSSLVGTGATSWAGSRGPGTQAQQEQPEFATQGQKLIREGKLDEAMALYKSVLQTSPESDIANNGVGVVLDLKGQYAEARKYFQRAIDVASNPQNKAVAQRSMAMSYAFEGNCKKASDYEQKVLDYWAEQKNYFDEGEAANEAGRVCIDAGDLDAAEKWYRRGHELGQKEPGLKPDRLDLWAFRWEHAQARLAARRGNADEAQRHVLAAKEILDKGTNPQQAPFFPYLVGYVAYYTGDYAAALVALAKANQNDPFIQCLLGQSYEKLGEKDKATDSYRKAAAAIAHNPLAAYAVPFAKKRLTSLAG